jgi:hypothetical protein
VAEAEPKVGQGISHDTGGGRNVEPREQSAASLGEPTGSRNSASVRGEPDARFRRRTRTGYFFAGGCLAMIWSLILS